MLEKMDLWSMFLENHASFEIERECLRTMCILDPQLVGTEGVLFCTAWTQVTGIQVYVCNMLTCM